MFHAVQLAGNQHRSHLVICGNPRHLYSDRGIIHLEIKTPGPRERNTGVSNAVPK